MRAVGTHTPESPQHTKQRVVVGAEHSEESTHGFPNQEGSARREGQIGIARTHVVPWPSQSVAWAETRKFYSSSGGGHSSPSNMAPSRCHAARRIAHWLGRAVRCHGIGRASLRLAQLVLIRRPKAALMPQGTVSSTALSTGVRVKSQVGNFAKNYLSREALEASLKIAGVMATGAGIAQAVDSNVFSTMPAFSLLGVVLATMFLTYVLARPRESMVYRFPDTGCNLVIEVGDVFNAPVTVVTANQTLDHEHEKVGRDSLMGQLLTRFPISRERLEGHQMFPHKGAGLDPGELLDLRMDHPGDPARVLVLSCGRPSPDGSETSWSELALALNGLWSGIRSRNLSEVAVPVIGSGFSGARQSHAALLQVLLLTYVNASNDRQVARNLRVVVSPEDFDWDSWLRAGRLLRGLGLRKR